MIDDPPLPPDAPDGDPGPGSGDDHADEGDVSLFHASWTEPRQGLDFASIVEHYGQRLFVLAYRLTGDRVQAEELSQETLVSSREALAGGAWTAFDLCRALVQDWRASLAGRWGIPSLAAPWRRPDGRAAGIAPGDWLQAALLRLGPRDREVLVLRVGEGLDYEEVAAALGEPVGVVQRRLLRARRHLHDEVGHRVAGDRGGPVRRAPGRRLAPAAARAMNLYLDDRSSRSARTEFERRLDEEPALRAEVEFHRGLTLEFQEEAPFLPRDYARRTLARLERAAPAARSGGVGAVFGRSHGGRRWRPSGAHLALAGVATVLLAVGLAGALRWIAARRAASNASATPGVEEGAAPPPAGDTQADEETLQALRSLGYLGSGAARKGASAGKEAAPPRKPAAKQSPRPAPRPRTTPAAAPAATPRPTPAAAPQATPSPIPTPTPEPLETPAPAPTATSDAAGPAGEAASTPTPRPPETQPPAGEAIGHRAVPAPRAPEAGRDHEVIESPEAWAALHEAAGSPAPAIDFQTHWVVLLRDGLGTDPPSRLRVAAVRRDDGTVEIVCHAEPIDPAGDAVPPPGQALVLPAPVSPVRIVIARP